MVSQRSGWKLLGCKEYICPSCGRDKGMIYLFKDGTLRYVCFCGVNIKLKYIEDKYCFNKKEFVSQTVQKSEESK